MEAAGKGRRVVTSTAGAQDKMVIDSIMQRFRPIAPKPVTGGSSKCEAIEDRKSFMGRNRSRTKRKYVRVRKNNNNDDKNGYRRKTKVSTTDLEEDTDYDDSSSCKNIVTLQLLPEKDDPGLGGSNGRIVTGDLLGDDQDPLVSLTGSSEEDNLMIIGLTPSDSTVAESWVTVESVTGTCADELYLGDHVGRTGVEIVKRLEADTCPGFVSDELNRVRWVNGAYRGMMGLNVGDSVRVWLVVKVEDLIRKETMTCMAGRARIHYGSMWRKEINCPAVVKMTVPCDVWRMGFGWLAWRLDVQAALSLGR